MDLGEVCECGLIPDDKNAAMLRLSKDIEIKAGNCAPTIMTQHTSGGWSVALE